MSRKSTASICFAVLCLISTVPAQSLVQVRAWQFHELDMKYVSGAMKLAPQYDVNTVVFSHGMIGETSQLYDSGDRAAKLKQLAVEAHDLGLQVWIWVHELADVPERFLENKRVQLDRDGFWPWLEQRYRTLFDDFPGFDGLILTFHETEYRIFRDSQVQSELPMPERFARLIGSIYKACAAQAKSLIVRTFLYEPEELEWIRQGLLKSDPGVMVQSKCVPHDWDPYYPHNPLIGAFARNRQIVEFDGSSEYTGRNRVPYACPEYFEYRWRHAMSRPGVVGYNVRLDHAGYDALYTPNEINIYTLFRLSRDRALTANDIWKEWTERRYGRPAAAAVENALRPTFEVVNRSFYPLKFWITNHSELPGFRYADGHISSRTLAKWWPERPEYKVLEHQLNHPDPWVLERILAEKDTAIALAHETLGALFEARPFMTPGVYDDLYQRLELLNRTALVWKLHAEAFFGYKVLEEGHEVPGLLERVRRAVAALKRQVEVSATVPGFGEGPPASAAEIREVAAELAEKIRIKFGP